MLTRTLLTVLLLMPLGCSLATEPGSGTKVDQSLQGGSQDEGAPRDIVFRAERSSYRHGETARIVLRNGTGQPLGYNLCHSARELRSGGEWRRFQPLRICTAALYTLAPGAETTHTEPITSEWQAGEYRVVTAVERLGSGARTEIVTPTFTVTP